MRIEELGIGADLLLLAVLLLHTNPNTFEFQAQKVEG